MIFNVSGGGGTALNFRVVGETTAPSNPKENTIWVNTSTPITSWVFSATQPTVASGKVWISIGTSSTVEFNALKNNGIQVYPISAKQYVSGAWVDKTAKSYQNGDWVDWIITLWNASKNYENLSALGSKGFYITANNPGKSGSLTKNSNGMVLNSNAADNIVKVSHDNIIDFANKSELVVKWSGGIVYGGYQGIGIFPTNAPSSSSEAFAFLEKNNTIEETVPLHVKGVNQKGYVVCFGYRENLNISEIVLK